MSVRHLPAPWISRQLESLLMQRGHAWLLHGPSGLGQYELALELARAWLCETPLSNGVGCGQCASCHAIDVATHADLCVLMPEVQMLERKWPLGEKAQAEIDEKKRKPSKEIRVDAMRAAVEFTQRSNARGKGKVVLIFPAEAMNGISANTLLKTLEEPTGDVKFILATESSHQLLPTIRSRCLAHAMAWPSQQESLEWLKNHDVGQEIASALLCASGNRPALALSMGLAGWSTESWFDFPAWMVKGQLEMVKDWPVAEIIDTQQKLCYDLFSIDVGAAPRYFPIKSVQGVRVSLKCLLEWNQRLVAVKRNAEHPFNEGLMREMLVGQAKTALNSIH